MATNPPNQSKLTKQELLEWANFLYGRYEYKYRKKPLKIIVEQSIIELDTNRDKPNK